MNAVRASDAHALRDRLAATRLGDAAFVFVGLAVSAIAFVFFVAIQSQLFGAASTLRSLTIAGAVVAVSATAFAYAAHRRSAWLCALLVSSAFLALLGLAFVGFVSSGEPEWGPVVDAAVIFTVAATFAHAGQRLRSSPRHHLRSG